MLRPVSITPFGLPVVPPVPGDHREIVDRLDVDSGSSARPASQPSKDGANGSSASRQTSVFSLGRSGRDRLDHRREVEWNSSRLQSNWSRMNSVLRRLVARIDRAPHRAGARDAEHAGKRERVVAGQDRDLLAGRDARAVERRARSR